MIQFYAPDIMETKSLPEGESAHCIKVLRMRTGDEVIVTDGKGYRYSCEIVKADPKHTEVQIKSQVKVNDERDFRLILAIAPTKNSDRMEWMVEKAVEIGIDKIVLLQCDRSERKTLRPDRLRKVMISAMKQSLSAYLPELSEIMKFKEFVTKDKFDAQKFFGYCSDALPKKSFVKECKPGGNIVVMIGPEGDFSLQEVDLAIENGFLPVTFGEKRLRTETAGVFAVCAVNVINQLS